MISYFQSIVLGIIQGVTEPFPVSSLGHSVIVPKLLGWNLTMSNDKFVTFLVATHFATALVFLGIFWDDWVRIVKGLVRSIAQRRLPPGDTDARLGWLLVIGTVPAGLIGLALQHPLEKLFGNGQLVAAVLILNGLMLLYAEGHRRRARVDEHDDDARLARSLSAKSAAGIGARAGAGPDPGLLALGRHDERRPAAGALAPRRGAVLVPAGDADHPGGGAAASCPACSGSAGSGIRGQALVGAIAAAIAAWLSIRFLLRYFRTNRLTPFGIYCIVAGAVSLVWLTVLGRAGARTPAAPVCARARPSGACRPATWRRSGSRTAAARPRGRSGRSGPSSRRRS